MRLQFDEQNKIIEYAKYYFGNDIKLYLFGSRVDDSKKGGDIDLFLDSKAEIKLQTQIDFLTALYKNVTHRKIDLLIKTPASENLPIHNIAKKEGILLC